MVITIAEPESYGLAALSDDERKFVEDLGALDRPIWVGSPATTGSIQLTDYLPADLDLLDDPEGYGRPNPGWVSRDDCT